MVYHVPHIIDGKRVKEIGASTKAISNPSTGALIGQVSFASKAHCDAAIRAAQSAWVSWSQTTPTKRAQIFFQFRTLLSKHQHDLAKIVSQEHGKTLDDAKGSIARGIELVDYHCSLVSQLQTTFSSDVSTDIDCYTIRQSLGVCAGISPFNFPVMVPIWMIIPAIACGNTFILKPSEQDPSAPVQLLELLHEAGLPPGVVNILHGDKTIVDDLIQHPDIAAVTAVASTPVAEYIYTHAIQNGKRAHTFGGAKNHCVVMPDANIEDASKAIIGAAFGSAGERCMAISVVVSVGEQTTERLLEQLESGIRNIHIDRSDASVVDMGPLISATHRQRVVDLINLGVKEGAKLLIDGRSFQHPKYPDGFYLGPSLFYKVTEEMSIYQQEIFGPVLVLIHVDDLEQAVALINRNQYGNGAAIFTQNGYSARKFAKHVTVGMVGINIPIPVPITNHSFGGWKRSFFGDTPMHGQESIRFYTKQKTITSKWLVNQINGSVFSMPENG